MSAINPYQPPASSDNDQEHGADGSADGSQADYGTIFFLAPAFILILYALALTYRNFFFNG